MTEYENELEEIFKTFVYDKPKTAESRCFYALKGYTSVYTGWVVLPSNWSRRQFLYRCKWYHQSISEYKEHHEVWRSAEDEE